MSVSAPSCTNTKILREILKPGANLACVQMKQGRRKERGRKKCQNNECAAKVRFPMWDNSKTIVDIQLLLALLLYNAGHQVHIGLDLVQFVVGVRWWIGATIKVWRECLRNELCGSIPALFSLRERRLSLSL